MNLGIEDIEDAHEIGAGGNGVVYRAKQTDLERAVAVKMVHLSADADNLRRFKRERQLMARMPVHPGIAPIFSSGVNETGLPYLVMPYYAAGSLQERLQRGPMPWREATGLISKVGEALEHAHQFNVLHLDLKPDNIMLDHGGNPVLVDFGISRLVDGNPGVSRAVQFTPAFAAPEAFEGARFDARTDIYSMGATLHSLIAGSMPFYTEEGLLAMSIKVINEPPADLRHLAPHAICECVERSMAKSPETRYQTPRAFVDALEAATNVAGAESGQIEAETPTRPGIPASSVPITPPTDPRSAGRRPPDPPPSTFHRVDVVAAGRGSADRPPDPPKNQPPVPPADTDRRPPPPPKHLVDSSKPPTPPTAGFGGGHSSAPPSAGSQQSIPPAPPGGPTAVPSGGGHIGGVSLADTGSFLPGGGTSAQNTPSGRVPILVGAAIVLAAITGLGIWALASRGDGRDVHEAGVGNEVETFAGDAQSDLDLQDRGTGSAEPSTTIAAAPPPSDPATTEALRPRLVRTIELRIGDCLDLPWGADAVELVEPIDCDVPHNSELAAISQHPAAGGSFPGSESLVAHGTAVCPELLAGYTGQAELSSELAPDAFLFPSQDEWDKDEFYSVFCFVVRADLTATSQTSRG